TDNGDGTITVAAGVTSFNVTIPTSPDSTDEADETLTLTVGGTAGTGTIIDDDFSPVAMSDVGAVAEDATLTRTALTGVIQGAPGTDTDGDNTTVSLLVSGAVAGTGAVTQGVGVATSLAGTYGHLTLNADGSYTYVADQSAADALAAGVTANDVFTYSVKDPSNNISNTATLTITVTGTNDAPVLDLDASSAGTGFATIFNADNGNPVPIGDVDVSVTDPDNATITSATITIATNKDGTNDLLIPGTLPVGITASAYNSTTGVMTLSGTASLASYQAAIRAINFDTTGTSALARGINVVVNDGTAASNTATATISILGAGNAPVLDLDGNDSSGATGTAYLGRYTLGSGGVAIGDT
ncbi:MAG: VCBS domain-containing protein, partial [Candidatus Woesebacteria bacterium]|nr:VCBS domain-containing protein [Candidatus Woesebacteria bacterium]